jgi:hypothetical protein
MCVEDEGAEDSVGMKRVRGLVACLRLSLPALNEPRSDRCYWPNSRERVQKSVRR